MKRKVFEYYDEEKPFVDYFERCFETGMEFSEMEKNLDYLSVLYHEMVITELPIGVLIKNKPTVVDLFNRWVCCKNGNW